MSGKTFIYNPKSKVREPDWFLSEIGGQVKVELIGFKNIWSINGTILKKGDNVCLLETMNGGKIFINKEVTE